MVRHCYLHLLSRLLTICGAGWAGCNPLVAVQPDPLPTAAAIVARYHVGYVIKAQRLLSARSFQSCVAAKVRAYLLGVPCENHCM
jgi:hypothetical protein